MKESVAISVASECGSTGTSESQGVLREMFGYVEKNDFSKAEQAFRRHASAIKQTHRCTLIEQFVAMLDKKQNPCSTAGNLRFAGRLYKICGEWEMAQRVLTRAGALLSTC
ncbi:MAG: hypothetical protein ACNI27_12740 [Desulfovibrio sp.]